MALQCSWFSLTNCFLSSNQMKLFILLVKWKYLSCWYCWCCFVHFECYWYYFTRRQLPVKLTFHFINNVKHAEKYFYEEYVTWWQYVTDFVPISYSDNFLVWLLNLSEQNKLLKGVPENIFYCDSAMVQEYQGIWL